MTSNLDLATILGLLADYGRPTLNQFAGSATPGFSSAGLWSCEVGIKIVDPKDVPPEDAERYWRELSSGIRRCIGTSRDPTEAARLCLAACTEAMEGPHGRFLRPISVAEAKRQERARERDRKGAPI